jgi:outer membrane protein assembly factor BamD (BamD/ComL family)
MKIIHSLTVKTIFAALLLFSGCLTQQLFASDGEAAALFQQGLKEVKAKTYRQAAKTFLKAKDTADDVTLKGKALKEAMLNFRRAKLYGEEFKCIEMLLNSYSAQVDYATMVEREYAIGNIYFKGYRDPAFWQLRWVPWLTAPDKTLKVYLKALKRAPFSPQAPRVKLRVACLYIENGKIEKSLAILRNMIKDHPSEKITKFAYLELANALFQLAQTGDGDGKYNSEAIRLLRDFLKKYPKASECAWVEKTLLKTKDLAAKRLYSMAKFYNHMGKTETSERYLSDVLTKYPDTATVDDAEELLTHIDKEFAPTGFRPELKSRLQKYREMPIPEEDTPIMVTPQASGGKWLLPVRDLGLGAKNIKIKPLNTQEKE